MTLKGRPSVKGFMATKSWKGRHSCGLSVTPYGLGLGGREGGRGKVH